MRTPFVLLLLRPFPAQEVISAHARDLPERLEAEDARPLRLRVLKPCNTCNSRIQKR